LARDVLHGRYRALADERDWHRVGAHAVARHAAGGVGGAEEGNVTDAETILLYALSTLAQTCAALAAFVGAVGIYINSETPTGSLFHHCSERGSAKGSVR